MNKRTTWGVVVWEIGRGRRRRRKMQVYLNCIGGSVKWNIQIFLTSDFIWNQKKDMSVCRTGHNFQSLIHNLYILNISFSVYFKWDEKYVCIFRLTPHRYIYNTLAFLFLFLLISFYLTSCSAFIHLSI